MRSVVRNILIGAWLAVLLSSLLPILVMADQNPKCEDYNLEKAIKLEEGDVKDGTYPFDAGGTVYAVSLNNVETKTDDGKTEPVKFDWSATLKMTKVIVKGGPGANVYDYPGGSLGAADLTAPDGKGISHITFCYEKGATAVKLANFTAHSNNRLAFHIMSAAIAAFVLLLFALLRPSRS